MKRNRIGVRRQSTRWANEYHEVTVNGLALDVFLQGFAPGESVDGLVPTLLDWLEEPSERALVWSRVLPETGSSQWLPILMCPDDCDFTCTLIVVDVAADEAYVYWRRFGFDASDRSAEALGLAHKPILGVPPLVFARAEYIEMLDFFRSQLAEGM